ncbi:hypothetical protein HYU94_01865 [Candidatus Daviesbacteria bacterium]|nr:hypothetical protein [Candidatus Daviesbacteria bacterium]
MIFKLTAKNCQVSTHTREYINQRLKKIIQNLPDIEEDLIVFRLTIRKNIDKYHPPKTHPLVHKNYAKIKPALAYFEGSMAFRLDKRQLYVHFKGRTIDECIDRGFHLIFKELEKYKDLHLSSESKYPDHSSIRARFA